MNQITYLYNTFCHAHDSGKEVRVDFCTISKAFDSVWHAGLIHKLGQSLVKFSTGLRVISRTDNKGEFFLACLLTGLIIELESRRDPYLAPYYFCFISMTS